MKATKPKNLDEEYYVCWYCGWPGCDGECEEHKKLKQTNK